jgi:hypothetical protein
MTNKAHGSRFTAVIIINHPGANQHKNQNICSQIQYEHAHVCLNNTQQLNEHYNSTLKYHHNNTRNYTTNEK